MSKFTAGKWKYLDELYQVCAYTNSEPNLLLADITGAIGCKGFFNEGEIGCKKGFFNEEEVHANGRLIAAAPEMYELLKVWAKQQAQTTLMAAQKRAQGLLARIDVEEAKDE